MVMAKQLFALARSLLFAALFVALWTWFMPQWLAEGRRLHPDPNPLAIVLMTIGGFIMARCVFDFAWRGLGTPAPFDAPRRLVVSGLYRWVRNPMYAGMGFFLAGEALFLPQITRQMLIMAALLWGSVTIFIVVYEEPVLRQKFGEEYESYCRHVHRWLPRLTPFDKAQALP